MREKEYYIEVDYSFKRVPIPEAGHAKDDHQFRIDLIKVF